MTKQRTSELRIGISGWTYPAWRGIFYPSGLPHRRELEYASRQLSSIEINGSFYSLQRPSSFARWRDETPERFVFAVKGSRFITHMKKLVGVDTALANFFASGVLRLGPKLGPILWQLPPQLGFDARRVADFLARLPRTTVEAAELARRHDARLKAGAWTEAEADQPIRHAFEVRHESYLVPEFVEMLREHGAALVFADSAGTWPYAEELTADFVYVRLHGSEQLYASGYTDSELQWWADRIRTWRAGGWPADAVRVEGAPSPAARKRDVYVYFDNDAKVHAPGDAMRLAAMLASDGKGRSADG
ncbi:MAG TPA: DUF72 domain-containing protein [Longimicrobiales bacterium]|nr:DUF72 domain-containing protein [Longimicrobiales bacterium]